MWPISSPCCRTRGSTESAQRIVRQYLGTRAAEPLATLAVQHRWSWTRRLAAGLLKDTGGMETIPPGRQALIALRTARTCEERQKRLRTIKDLEARETLPILRGLVERRDCGKPVKVCYGCLEQDLAGLLSLWGGGVDAGTDGNANGISAPR